MDENASADDLANDKKYVMDAFERKLIDFN